MYLKINQDNFFLTNEVCHLSKTTQLKSIWKQITLIVVSLEERFFPLISEIQQLFSDFSRFDKFHMLQNMEYAKIILGLD